MKKASRGGRLESAVVLGEDGLRNPEPLRFPDEFVRHKVLDLLGDLSLLAADVVGTVIGVRAGHGLHVALARALRAQEG